LRMTSKLKQKNARTAKESAGRFRTDDDRPRDKDVIKCYAPSSSFIGIRRKIKVQSVDL
jgi:hypothetical protein